jgi:GntR family transcriptional regulator
MEPRHAQLTRSLLKAIADGHYPVGAILPGEIAIAERFGVSRGTVRLALGRLVDMGLVSRRKRAGTRVEAVRPEGAFATQVSTIRELVQYGAQTHRTVRDMREVVADRALAAQIGCAPGERWFNIRTVRTALERPDRALSWTDNYVAVDDGAKIRRSVGRSQALLCDLICRATGRVVKEVRQQILAVGLGAELAGELDATSGMPALEIRRHYIDQSDRLFEIAVNTVPADRMVYHTVLRRG